MTIETTADMFGTLRISLKPTSAFSFEMPSVAYSANELDTVPVLELLSDQPIAVVKAPTPITPKWLPTIQHRILSSVNPPDIEYVNDGRWLTSEIATQALNFFAATSDLLPGEPYLYTSIDGDLVAEFKGKRGTLTNVVGKISVLAFASVDGKIHNASLKIAESDVDKVRAGLRQLTERLS
ncbi:MAG TPA: hypothetical protein VGG46_12005 [Terriglobales bacterium]|jgi:hypothetical protein